MKLTVVVMVTIMIVMKVISYHLLLTLMTTRVAVQGCKLEESWGDQSQIGRSLILGSLLLLDLPSCIMKRSKTTKPWTPCTLPCPACSFTASLLSNEVHEQWAVYVCSGSGSAGGEAGNRDLPPDSPAPHNRWACTTLPHLRHFGRARWRPDPPFLQARRQIYSVLRRTR